MPLAVRAFPITKGREELTKFIEELQEERASETDAFYRRFGVTREAWFWQETPYGPLVIVFTDADDLTEAPQVYARADEPFESWFKQQSLRLTGIDLNQTPLGPPSEMVFEWVDQERLRPDASRTRQS
jgi:hypothetical protein